MYWTKTLIPTQKQEPQEAESISSRLLLRAGFIRMLLSGVYSYLPLGFIVLNNIEQIIRQEMDAIGASELLLPALQPLELWTKSGRNKDMGEVMIKFVDRRGRNICLGPTHEEVITDLMKNYILSYKQLPLIMYQIQTKFRDEIRPRFGLVRACEFIMKDAYSFDRDEEGLNKNYQAMYEAYQRIFKRCGLDCLSIEADPGVMGGKVSHEFMVCAESGEDIVLVCPKCSCSGAAAGGTQKSCAKCNSALEKKNAIEIGHIFKLGTKYSASLEANFIDAQGNKKPVIMGCYGIGVSRLIPAIVEQNHDEQGIIWPAEISPYKAIILPLDSTDKEIFTRAENIYRELKEQSVEALIDDRDERAGVKFKDADLIGIPLQIIVGKESLKDNMVELKIRRGNKKLKVKKGDLVKQIKEIKNEQG